MVSNDLNLDEFITNLTTKQTRTGYAFFVGEGLHPVYFDEYVQSMDIDEAWRLLCLNWLHKVFSIHSGFIGLLPYVLRMKICNDRIIAGHMSKVHLQDVREAFNLPDDFPVEIQDSFQIQPIVRKSQLESFKRLYGHAGYLETLPWSVRVKLSRSKIPEVAAAAGNQNVQRSHVLVKAKMNLAD